MTTVWGFSKIMKSARYDLFVHLLCVSSYFWMFTNSCWLFCVKIWDWVNIIIIIIIVIIIIILPGATRLLLISWTRPPCRDSCHDHHNHHRDHHCHHHHHHRHFTWSYKVAIDIMDKASLQRFTRKLSWVVRGSQGGARSVTLITWS